MKKIAIIGHFGFGKNLINGQTIKTKNLADALLTVKDIDLTTVDTCGWKKHPLSLVKKIKQAIRCCDSVIMLPAQNGVQIFSRLLLWLNRGKNKKLYYNVIGAWLPSLLKQKKRLIGILRKFDGIWVETNTMRNALSEMKFDNVTVVKNFKKLTPVEQNQISNSIDFPIKLVIFSRISELKGVSDAISAVSKINKGEKKYTLSIYGPVDETYKPNFEGLVAQSSEFVSYRGVVDASESVSVLKDYDALLFPTKSYTEGVPGTIVDAYSAGLPIIASRWESYADICKEGVTAIGYDFNASNALLNVLTALSENPQILVEMKSNALKEAENYTVESVLTTVLNLL